MGRIGLLEGATRPPLTSPAALENALVDNAALVALIRRGFKLEIRGNGAIVGKRIGKR